MNHVVGSMIQGDHWCNAVTCKLLSEAYINYIDHITSSPKFKLITWPGLQVVY